MEGSHGIVRGVSLRAAACILAGDVRDPVAGERVRRAVDAQLRRAGVEAQDADDVRTEVVLALLCAPAGELPLPLELVCARAAVIARNKAIDHGRRRARAPVALGGALPEPAPPGELPGSLADGLDEVAAAAHRRRVHADLARALDRLDAAQRAAISAHASGGAARGAGLPRSSYYRALARAQARLRSDLRGRLTGLGALGDLARAARELFAHVEGAHAAAAAATTAVAVTAAVGLNWHDEGAPRLVPSVVVQPASGGRVQPAPVPASRARTLSRRVGGTVRTRRVTVSPPLPAAATPSHASRSYDPSSYDP
jgi:DNA-directed RNA polymerase specialized sigma24 family protein